LVVGESQSIGGLLESPPKRRSVVGGCCLSFSSTTEEHQGTRPVFFQEDLTSASVKAFC